VLRGCPRQTLRAIPDDGPPISCKSADLLRVSASLKSSGGFASEPPAAPCSDASPRGRPLTRVEGGNQLRVGIVQMSRRTVPFAGTVGEVVGRGQDQPWSIIPTTSCEPRRKRRAVFARTSQEYRRTFSIKAGLSPEPSLTGAASSRRSPATAIPGAESRSRTGLPVDVQILPASS